MFCLINHIDENLTNNKHISLIFNKLVNENNCFFISTTELNNNKGNIKNYILEKFNSLPQYYLTFYGIGSIIDIHKELTSFCKIVCILIDIHHSSKLIKPKLNVINNIDIILCTSGFEYNRWNMPINKKTFFFPHSAAWIIDFNHNPINKILISGRVSNIYQDRLFMYELSKTNKNLEILKCNFKYSIDTNNPNNLNLLFGKNFYNQLNKYICCFVDTARDYMLAKIFEICATGSLLLTMNENIKDIFSDLGFIDNHNYISCNRENIIQKIDFITNPNNIHIINNIRKNGYELVKSNHTFINRYNMLLDILNNNNTNYFNSHYTLKTSNFNTTYYYSSSSSLVS